MYDIFITEKELLGKTYELWKKQQASPAIIQFAIFDDNDVVLKCQISFTQCMYGSDSNYLYDYADVDIVLAESMFKHLRRNLITLQNQEKMKDIKLEKKLAAFDAKVLRDKAKKKGK
ncbi:hypothetical protein MASR1M36_06020 [Candidatus Cloacimonadaceae bacterium]